MFLLLFIGILFFSVKGQGFVELETKELRIVIDPQGAVKSIEDKKQNVNYLLGDDPAFLLSIRVKGKYDHPESVVRNDDHLDLSFKTGCHVLLKVKEYDDYLSLEVDTITGENKDNIDLVVWGPYFSTIDDTIGETVGVVRNKDFALGIQSLNIKTLGGYPWNENDCMPSIDIFEQKNYEDMNPEGKRYVLYNVEAAKPVAGGSSLQAYCRNRDKERVIENMGYSKYVAPAWHDGGVMGSKIALFGCRPPDVLRVISKIEQQEGLPHTMMNGHWAKTYDKASAAYLIMDFDERTIDEALEVVRKAGFNNLYHPGPFKTWGHFEILRRQFPQGVEGLKACVDKAKEEGITLGIHTLSNFITRNDPYVTPVPDKRLARVGSSVIIKNIGTKDPEIEIASPEFFKEYKNSTLKTVRIGDELIRFRSVSEDEPWRLLDCRRGAYHTVASKHHKGDTVSLLADHAYKVFLTNAELTEEVSKNIARLFNETGLCQISFDGLEGNFSTGLGTYGEVMMPYVWYENLNDSVRNNIIVHASRTTHFFWHIYTRMNWGEPWYADFRSSQTEYRMKNQKYFQRNYMPAMLGWFNMRDGMSMEDLEWMLARSAAFNAGYAFVVSLKGLRKHGQSDKLLEKMKQWERARLSGAFPDSIRKEMEDVANEYHLEAVSDTSWDLYRVKVYMAEHTSLTRQPGEPVYTSKEIDNPYHEQQPVITVRVMKDTRCENVTLEFDDYRTIIFPFKLFKGQVVRYEGGETATVYDKNMKEVGKVKVKGEKIILEHGYHTVNVDAELTGGDEPAIKVEIKYLSEPVLITSKK